MIESNKLCQIIFIVCKFSRLYLLTIYNQNDWNNQNIIKMNDWNDWNQNDPNLALPYLGRCKNPDIC